MSFNEWKEVSFEESGLEIEDGDRGKKYPNKSQLLKEGYCPFLNNKNITGDKLNFEETDFITKERDEMLRKGKAYRGDIILTTRGSVGNVALFDENVKYNFVRINSGMVIIRNNKLFDLKFLYQQLKSPYMKSQYKNMSTGSAQPQLPIKDIRKLKLLIPALEEQKAIAHILSTIDEKIETNNQINKKLEKIAQAIFKQWFVEFEFPNEDGEPYKSSGGEMVESELGRIPKGWNVITLDDICYFNDKTYSSSDKFDYINYLDTSNITENKINTVQKINCYNEKVPSRAKRKIVKDSIVYSTVRPNQLHYGIIKKPVENMIVSTGFVVIDSRLDFLKNDLVYLWLTQNEVTTKLQAIAETSTSTYPSIKPSDIKSIKIAFPNRDILRNISNIFSEINLYIATLQEENNNLSMIRDKLIPKLMSGEIRIP